METRLEAVEEELRLARSRKEAPDDTSELDNSMTSRSLMGAPFTNRCADP